MYKLCFLIILLFCFSFYLYSQQDPQVSLNKYNLLPINPGFAGSNGSICASLLYRMQWIGFEGAPRTMIFSGDMFLQNLNSGVGLNIYNDALGFEKNTYVNGNFSYHLKVGDGDLGLGLGIGAINKSLDGDWITPDKLLGKQQNPYSDPAIPHSESRVVFDANFGLFYRSADDKIYGGISTTHLTQPQVKFSLSKTPYMRRHYYVTVGSYIEMPDKNWGLNPSAFIKYDGSTAQYDLNLLVEYRRQFRGGLSYRLGDAFIFIAGFTTQSNITVALAYDLTVSKLKSYEKGSLEFFAKYCFTITTTSTRGKYGSVRFL
ncbi:MAG: PorP/SprF family type IX secretion system membrane protein [Bacteroidales bacterium]|nr:PorP/SprF family type IX secretion system membrane protein [Bacteroidales bacterium]